MKTINLEMITARIMFTIANLTSAPSHRTFLQGRRYLGFEEAMQHNELILALYQQTQAQLPSARTPFYLSAVIIEDMQYIVMGSYKEWKWFYSTKWEYLLRACPCAISIN